MEKKEKKAFTTVEVIVALVIAAILTIMTIVISNPSNKAVKLAYTKVYHALTNSIFNYLVENDAAFPENGTELCKVFSSVMNISGGQNDNCNNILYQSHPGDTKTFDREKFSIKAVNGIKMWIEGNSDRRGPFELTQKAGDKEIKVKYYVVYADLNAELNPNTAAWNPDLPADIVAFIVTDDASVVPIGYPEIDSRYLDVRVVQTAEDENGNIQTSDPMTYYEAKKAIWDNKVDEARIQTFNFQGELLDDSLFKMIEGDGTKKNDYKKYFPNVQKLSICETVDCEIKIYDYL